MFPNDTRSYKIISNKTALRELQHKALNTQVRSKAIKRSHWLGMLTPHELMSFFLEKKRRETFFGDLVVKTKQTQNEIFMFSHGRTKQKHEWNEME